MPADKVTLGVETEAKARALIENDPAVRDDMMTKLYPCHVALSR